MKNLLTILSLSCVGLALGACDALKDLEDLNKIEYTLNGYVTDVDTGKPIIGVTIQMGEQRDLTDPEGHFAIKVSAMGERDVNFDAQGYKPASARVNIDRNKVDLNIGLTKADVDYTPHQFYGYLIDEATNRSIGHMRVYIHEELYESDDSGRFKFKDAIDAYTFKDQDIRLTNDCLEFSRLGFFAYPQYSYLAIYVKVTSKGTEAFGDLNGDRVVDIKDVDIFVPAMNTSRGDSRFSDKADLDKNGLIDIRDYNILRSNFGKVLIGAECVES